MNANTKIGVLSGLLAIFVLAFALRGLSSSAAHFSNPEPRERHSIKPAAYRISELPNVGYSSSSLAGVSSSPSGWKVGPGKTMTPPSPLDRPSGSDRAKASTNVKPPTRIAKIVRYTVRPGDNLTLIAKRFYGDEQGNRHKVVDALFAANRHALRSADKLRVGQTLVIPDLPLANSGAQPSTRDAASVHPKPFKAPLHRVREGESLWKIAESRLGDGSRFLDIFRLNRDLIEEEDRLRPGLELRLPAR